mgnify:CR=1 FL=1
MNKIMFVAPNARVRLPLWMIVYYIIVPVAVKRTQSCKVIDIVLIADRL